MLKTQLGTTDVCCSWLAIPSYSYYSSSSSDAPTPNDTSELVQNMLPSGGWGNFLLLKDPISL